jgi:hypothetical protein
MATTLSTPQQGQQGLKKSLQATTGLEHFFLVHAT